jgi:hypothetical protein
MPDRVLRRAFTVSYDKPVNKLITSVGVLPILTVDKILSGVPLEVKALWDTGATVTCIKPELFERLKLRLFNLTGHTTLSGIGGNVAAKVTLVSLLLTPTLEIEYRPVYVTEFPSNADMLIGMDIIRMGDFAVCNADGKTSFSFAVPPFPDRIDLAEKTEADNKRDTV